MCLQAEQVTRRSFVQELLRSAAAAPGTAVARLNLIPPPEVTQVLRTFNAWDLPYTELLNPEKQTIHGMFEHWAQHTPQAPALTFGVRCEGLPHHEYSGDL